MRADALGDRGGARARNRGCGMCGPAGRWRAGRTSPRGWPTRGLRTRGILVPEGWARDRQPDPTVFDGARYPGDLAWANVSFGLSHPAVTTTGVDERVFSGRG